MKVILLLSVLFMSFGCGLFETSKPAIVTSIGKGVQALSKSVLKCETGEAAREDVEKKLSEMLKVKSGGEKSLAASSIGSAICSGAVSLVLPALTNLGNAKGLPQSWKDDGCSLDNVGGKVEGLAKKLCEKI